MENAHWPEIIPEGYCVACRQPETKLVRLTDESRLSQTETTVCQNIKCPLFIDIAKVKTWIVKNTGHYNRDFERGKNINFHAHPSKRKHAREIKVIHF